MEGPQNGRRRQQSNEDDHHHHTNNNTIGHLLQRLVQTHIDNKNNGGMVVETTKQRVHKEMLVTYCNRIITSRIGVPSSSSSSLVIDEQSVCDSIKKKLVKDERTNDALKFEDLYRRLLQATSSADSSTQLSSQQRWSMLHLLNTLFNSHAEAQHKQVWFAGQGLPSIPVPLPQSSFGVALATPENLKSVPLPQSTQKQAVTTTPKGIVPFQINKDQIHEALLIKDVIYALQGINGRYIKFKPPSLDQHYGSFEITTEAASLLTKPTSDLMEKICELGNLLVAIKPYTDKLLAPVLPSSLMASSLPLVNQSFCSSIQQELLSYHKMVATLEAQCTVSNTMTLKRIWVWCQEPLHRLRSIHHMVSECKNIQGGALVSTIYKCLEHGDPQFKRLAGKILRITVRPVFKMLRIWILEGELEDPFHEFFIAADMSVPLSRLWSDKYSIFKPMLPQFISLELASKILLIGKSINFLRECCGEKDIETSIAINEDELDFSKITELESLIENAGQIISRRLLKTFYDKYQFSEHCNSIKRYLLLEQGDFIQHLLVLLSEELNKPISNIYRHNLLTILESAIQKSNVQYHSQNFVNRLDVKLLDSSEATKLGLVPTGWNLFLLYYHVDAPLDAVFSPTAMDHYLRLFNFLFNLQRIQSDLSRTWNKFTKGQSKAAACQHKAQLIRSEMLHFLYSLQYFLMVEVIETSWNKFLEASKTASDLDQLISAQTTCISSIAKQALQIGVTVSDGERTAAQCGLASILQNVTKFRTIFENLHSLVQRDTIELERIVHEKKVLTEKGKWGVVGEDKEASHLSKYAQLYKAVIYQLGEVSREYQSNLAQYKQLLSAPSSSPVGNVVTSSSSPSLTNFASPSSTSVLVHPVPSSVPTALSKQSECNFLMFINRY